MDGRTHRAKCRDSYGGVGRNIAAALVALGLENTRFITVVGEDVAGKGIVQDLGQTGETIESLSELVTPRYDLYNLPNISVNDFFLRNFSKLKIYRYFYS